MVDVVPEGTVKTTEAIRQRVPSDYLKPLTKHTLLIGLLVLLALIGGILVWALTFGTSSYEGEVLVLFKPNANSQVDLSANPQFRDVTLDVTRQQQNAVLLMSSMDVSREVQKRAAASSDSSIAAFASKNPLALRDSIHVQIQGSFISVKGQAPTVSSATWLANTWADVGIADVNRIYAQPSANVDAALQQAKSQLDADQTALQDFISHNPTITLTAELSQTNAFINSAVTSSSSSTFVLYDSEQQSIRDQVSTNYTVTAALNQQLNQIGALRTRIQQSPEDQASLYANQVSLLLLLNSVIAGTTQSDSESRLQLQLSLADVSNQQLSKSSQLGQIDAAIKAIEGLQEDLSSQTAELENKLRSPSPAATPGQSTALSPALQANIARQSQLQSQLEQKTFQFNRLQKTRDLDRSTYDLLRSRLAEQNVNGMISDIVVVGSAADEEQTARSRSILRSLVLGTGQWILVALALGIVLAYLLYLVRPNFNSNDVIGRRLSRGRPRSFRVSSSE